MRNFNLLISFIFLISMNLNAQDFSEQINSSLYKLIERGNLNLQDINWNISSQHISSTSKIHHIYYNQVINGIQIKNTESSIHLLSNGDLLSSHNNFIKNVSAKITGSNSPSISAIDAINLISKELNYTTKESFKIISKYAGNNQNTLISNGGISRNDIPAKLVYIKDVDDNLSLSWEISILENDLNHWWVIYVNANSGNIINKTDNVYTCNNENKKNNNNSPLSSLSFDNSRASSFNCAGCYEVIPMPLESPYYGDRIVLSNPIDYFSSPLGWHNDGQIPGGEYTYTKGNNINAYIGNEDNFEYQPDGGSYLDFTNYLFNQNFNENFRYEDAAITNLFYWGNILHDVFYRYGFNEVSGNFQVNNFEKGGEENDLVAILGQQDLNLCNAKISISKDGIKPFISINACGNKDGAFDNIVLIHEYLHGVSFRLTGGANSDNCLAFGEQMTEGWSDWYALMMTMSPNDISTKPRGIATYLFNEGENGMGIRDYPYTTDMSLNPQTYDYIKTNQGTHDIGSVWAAMLWELTWKLIEEYGFDENIYNFSGNLNQDAGNIIAFAIVTEGMKLQPCNPGFVDGRDAILTAYHAIYGWEKDCLIWDAFAKRGLGVSANQGSSFFIGDGFESFDVPSFIAEFDKFYDNICINSNEVSGLDGGFPVGGIYSGLGVTDDGNGLTFSFNPSIAGEGTHTIYYEVFDSYCSEASIDENIITVIVDEESPEIICIDDVLIIVSSNQEQYTVPDFSYNILVSDNCFSSPTIQQRPLPGVDIGIGNTVVTMTSIDASGNETNCSFILTVERESVETTIKFEVYPNPSNGELILYSDENFEKLTATIFDVNGKLIQTKIFNDFGLAKSINIEKFTKGVYFIKIEATNFSTVKIIIKK